MGKRNQRGGDSDANPRKRQKTVHEVPSSEEIYTSRQLQQLLAFDQDVKKVRHGMGFPLSFSPSSYRFPYGDLSY